MKKNWIIRACMLLVISFVATIVILDVVKANKEERISIIIGYDSNKKSELFGSMTELEIANRIEENKERLIKADKEGSLQDVVRKIEEEGFCVIIKNREVKTKPCMITMENKKN